MASEGDFETFTLITTASEEMAKGGIGDKLAAGRDWLKQRQAGVRSWGEFINVRNISRPSGVGEATSRLLTNLRHYHANYLFVFLGLALYAVISNPLLLFGVAFWFAAFWYISIRNKGDTVSIIGRSFTPAELYMFMAVVSIPVCYIAGAGSAIFWIIGASVVVILVHAVMMKPASAGEEEGIVLEDVVVN